MPRSKGTELSPQLRSIILELRDIGWSYQKITTKHLLPKSTVQSIVRPPPPPPPLFPLLPARFLSLD